MIDPEAEEIIIQQQIFHGPASSINGLGIAELKGVTGNLISQIEHTPLTRLESETRKSVASKERWLR